MDKNTAKLVADLARRLSVELDLHYSDTQLARFNHDDIEAIHRAFNALHKARASVPKVLEHVILRAARGEQWIATYEGTSTAPKADER